MTIGEISEKDSCSECPECGSENVQRRGDEFHCHECEEAQTDVTGGNRLQSKEGPMARPAALRAGCRRDASIDGAYWEWNEHE
ncbi:MAG: hypothetical protein J07HQX50_02166 [Haloquadratum sp. J07HQX50]|jgi:hypothetical protein|nr:MAG: hypothetical protein J07HQX50_02166 [Haloquadratum sp. J07HQX50]